MALERSWLVLDKNWHSRLRPKGGYKKLNEESLESRCKEDYFSTKNCFSQIHNLYSMIIN